MLDVGVTVKVIGGLVGIVALHHIVEEVLHQFPVFLSLVQIGHFHRTVDLGVAGGVRLRSKGSQVVPMLGDLAIFIKAEDVKGHLLASTGEVINGLEEHIVPVLKGTDVFHGGLYIGRRQVFHGADKGILPRAIGQIVLDVVLVQQLTGSIRIAGSEGADQGQSLFGVGLFRLGVAFHLAAGRAAFGSRTGVRGGSSVAGTSGQNGSNQCQRKGAGNKLFHCDNLLWGIVVFYGVPRFRPEPRRCAADRGGPSQPRPP